MPAKKKAKKAAKKKVAKKKRSIVFFRKHSGTRRGVFYCSVINDREINRIIGGMLEGLKKMFQKRSLAALEEKVKEISALEPRMAALSDAELTTKSLALRERVRAAGEFADTACCTLPSMTVAVEAFALVREAAKRTLGQRPFDVQFSADSCCIAARSPR